MIVLYVSFWYITLCYITADYMFFSGTVFSKAPRGLAAVSRSEKSVSGTTTTTTNNNNNNNNSNHNHNQYHNNNNNNNDNDTNNNTQNEHNTHHKHHNNHDNNNDNIITVTKRGIRKGGSDKQLLKGLFSVNCFKSLEREGPFFRRTPFRILLLGDGDRNLRAVLSPRPRFVMLCLLLMV